MWDQCTPSIYATCSLFVAVYLKSEQTERRHLGAHAKMAVNMHAAAGQREDPLVALLVWTA